MNDSKVILTEQPDDDEEFRKMFLPLIEYLKEVCDTTKEIMENIKWRHQNIKNMIEWRKFTSGI